MKEGKPSKALREKEKAISPARKRQSRPDDELSYYFGRIQDFSTIPLAEEKRLFDIIAKAKREGASEEEFEEAERARANLVEANLGLVVSVAKRYVGDSLSLMDLIQAGQQGLLKAIDHFDPEKNVKLSTYAYRGILNEVRSFAREQYAANNLQGGRYSLYIRALEAEKKLERLGNGKPTYQEIATELGESDPKKVEEALSLPYGLLSIDEPYQKGGEASLLHSLASSSSLEETLKDESRLEALEEALLNLSERERYILKANYGLDGAKKRSLKAIGEELSLSGERVRQIKLEAIYRLRLALKGK